MDEEKECVSFNRRWVYLVLNKNQFEKYKIDYPTIKITKETADITPSADFL